ncbi:PhzF family phenazine biosynthesis protein [Gluconobacter sp. Dm-62]|uniref:PhzF family phenazine biosynthesis protein n=1 Tax=Gluconobacter sp. Dm-62 TaxID=2799804 RepID=UPI001B8BF5D5|nr:PhzF family phenazine biosynthesis protein [Gluconobacter sp. Dm-62]MBS1102838.1 PhzF family phenazine biosynthesis protein [Gluconobacter sp. Dm-62]
MDLIFQQVDVFSAEPFRGNPLAVIVGADALSDTQMAEIANWTNLSETTFLLKPTHPDADYHVRIFTPHAELPFAGHPTLGSAHVWSSLGHPTKSDVIMQQCGAGLVPVRKSKGRLAFAAPPRRRTGPVAQDDLILALKALRLTHDDILDAQWADNGPGWMVIRLPGREQVLSIQPDWHALKGQSIGVVGACHFELDRTKVQFEVRAFVGEGQGWEDPVTGSLNAGIAQWLIEGGIAPAHYIASQGTALRRSGRIFVDKIDSDIWIGGDVITRIAGTIAV